MMKRFLIALVMITCIFAMASCGELADHNDGKCDFCGREAYGHSGGYEVCWSCYREANENWNKTH